MPRVDSDDDDDDDDETTTEEIAHDEAIAMFLRRPPAAADHVVAIVCAPQGDHVLADRTAAEAKAKPVQLGNAIAQAAERWARTEGRALKFRATWQAGDRVLGSYQWTSGEGDPTALDGSVDSFLAQQQRHAEVLHRLHSEDFQLIQDSWRSQIASLMRRVEALEKDNEQLRARLRKAGDVDAEIAYSQVAADLEARARNADILEHKVLPVVQAILAQRMQTQAAAAAASSEAPATPGASSEAPAAPAEPAVAHGRSLPGEGVFAPRG